MSDEKSINVQGIVPDRESQASGTGRPERELEVRIEPDFADTGRWRVQSSSGHEPIPDSHCQVEGCDGPLYWHAALPGAPLCREHGVRKENQRGVAATAYANHVASRLQQRDRSDGS